MSSSLGPHVVYYAVLMHILRWVLCCVHKMINVSMSSSKPRLVYGYYTLFGSIWYAVPWGLKSLSREKKVRVLFLRHPFSKENIERATFAPFSLYTALETPPSRSYLLGKRSNHIDLWLTYYKLSMPKGPSYQSWAHIFKMHNLDLFFCIQLLFKFLCTI